MNDRDRILLLKIKGEAEYLLDRTKNSDLHEFIYDRDLQYIVTMALIKTGEYVKSLSDDLKRTNSDIRWASITNLRNIAAHKYDGLLMEDIWGNVTKDVPELLVQVKEILLAEEVEKGK